MQRRLIAAFLAVVLAGIGAILLFNYVSTADDRAMQNQDPTPVLVVTTAVPPGTLGSALGPFVTTKQIPKVALEPGALTSLDDVQHLATIVQLQPGQQLSSNWFGEPGTAANGDIAIPETMEVVSLQLEAQRTVGTRLTAGSRISAYSTLEGTTRRIFSDVLVVSSTEGLVTIAARPVDVQNLVLSLESGKVWLAESSKIASKVNPVSVKQLAG
jgi:pilus assembly protein CpaB